VSTADVDVKTKTIANGMSSVAAANVPTANANREGKEISASIISCATPLTYVTFPLGIPLWRRSHGEFAEVSRLVLTKTN